MSDIFDIASDATDEPEGEAARLLSEVAVTYAAYEDTGLTPDSINKMKKMLLYFLKQALDENDDKILEFLVEKEKIKEMMEEFRAL